MNPEYEVLRTAMMEMADNWDLFAESYACDPSTVDLRKTFSVALRRKVREMDEKMSWATVTPDMDTDAVQRLNRQSATIKHYQEVLIAHSAVCTVSTGVTLVDVLANEARRILNGKAEPL